MTSPIKIFSLAIVALLIAACGGGEEPTTETPEPEPIAEEPAPATDSEPEVTFDGPAFELSMAPVGNEMQFEQTEFTVQPGQTVHITFNNTADNPAMSHNVVVLAMGADANAIGQAAMRAVETDYIPPGMEDQIIAFTPMSAPGETVEVTFTAPGTPGDYTYICTFPGHYISMVGTMRVVAG